MARLGLGGAAGLRATSRAGGSATPASSDAFRAGRSLHGIGAKP
jgi:hypothetical protein